MPDQRDKLALVDLEVKILNYRQRAFGRRVDFVQLRERQVTFLNRAFLRVCYNLWHCMNWRDIGQGLALFDLGLDPHIHQIFGHTCAQRLERLVVVHGHSVAGAGDTYLNRIGQSAIRVERHNTVCKEDRLIHIIGDQDAGLFVALPNLQNFIRQIGPRQRIQRRERLVQQQHLGVHRQCARHSNPLAHPPRQFRRTSPDCMRQTHHRDVVIDLRLPLRLAELGENRIHGKSHIAAHR